MAETLDEGNGNVGGEVLTNNESNKYQIADVVFLSEIMLRADLTINNVTEQDIKRSYYLHWRD